MAVLNVLKDKDGNILKPYIPRYEEFVRRIRYGVKNVNFSDGAAWLFTMDEVQNLFNLKTCKPSDFVVFVSTVEEGNSVGNQLVVSIRIDKKGLLSGGGTSGGIRMILRDPNNVTVRISYSIFYMGDMTNMNP